MQRTYEIISAEFVTAPKELEELVKGTLVKVSYRWKEPFTSRGIKPYYVTVQNKYFKSKESLNEWLKDVGISIDDFKKVFRRES